MVSFPRHFVSYCISFRIILYIVDIIAVNDFPFLPFMIIDSNNQHGKRERARDRARERAREREGEREK